jgi:hypothetical protein
MVGGWPGESEHVPCGESLWHVAEPLSAHSHAFALHAAGCAHCGHLGVLTRQRAPCTRGGFHL